MYPHSWKPPYIKVHIWCITESHVELSVRQELPDDYDVAAEKASIFQSMLFIFGKSWLNVWFRVPGLSIGKYIGKLDYQTYPDNVEIAIVIVLLENDRLCPIMLYWDLKVNWIDRWSSFPPPQFKVSPVSFDARPSLTWWSNTKGSLQRIARMQDVSTFGPPFSQSTVDEYDIRLLRGHLNKCMCSCADCTKSRRIVALQCFACLKLIYPIY